MSVQIAKRAKGKRKLSFISEKQTKTVPKVFQNHILSTLLFANFAPPKSSKHDASHKQRNGTILFCIFTHNLYCKNIYFKPEPIGALAGVALTNMIPLSTPGQFGIFPTIARLVSLIPTKRLFSVQPTSRLVNQPTSLASS